MACAIFFESSAQDYETYVGKSKIYMWPLHADGTKYTACMYDWVGDSFNNTYYFSSVSIYDPSDNEFHTYSSAHGKYIAFQLFYHVVTGRKANCEQVVFWSRMGNDYGKRESLFAYC